MAVVDTTAARVVRERAAARAAGAAPRYVQPEWARRFPWLAQGTTSRGGVGEEFDLRLFGEQAVGPALDRWKRLKTAAGCARVVHSRQVHGDRILVHDAGPPGLFVGEDADGHVTVATGLLLTVSVADCVPVSVVDPGRRALLLLHAGWRGIAAGILESGLAAIERVAGCRPADLYLHLGPAICGACYEVGPEVHAALGLVEPATPEPVDLRAVLSARARKLGIGAGRLTASAWCTRCGDSPFYSHRGGHTGRQVGFLGVADD